MPSSIRSIAVIAFAGLLLAGCGSSPKDSDGSIRGVSSQQADQLGSERSVFENIKDPPFTTETRFAAGQLAESQGALPQAIVQYTEAVKIDPNYQPAWYRLGILYTQTRQFPKAIEAWEKYVAATNGSAAAYSNLGFCYELSGARARAEAAYKKGITNDPKNVPCRVNYGLLLTRMGNEAEALKQFQAVLTPAEAHYNVGSVYEQMGHKEQARAQYRKALELNPRLWEAETRLAQMK